MLSDKFTSNSNGMSVWVIVCTYEETKEEKDREKTREEEIEIHVV